MEERIDGVRMIGGVQIDRMVGFDDVGTTYRTGTITAKLPPMTNLSKVGCETGTGPGSSIRPGSVSQPSPLFH